MSRSSSWFEWPASRSRRENIAINTTLVLLIALADYASGWQVSWSTVYAYPIAITAWYVGIRWAYVLSLLSVILFTAGGVAPGFPFDNWLVSGWEAPLPVLFFPLPLYNLPPTPLVTHGPGVRVGGRTGEGRGEKA